jgi:FixJ family two-component response regulator
MSSQEGVMSFTVYLVDDDPNVLKALSRIVRASGYECQSFRSPYDFLRDLDLLGPGCAIIDLTMPGLDGLELQQKMAQSGNDRPVIFLTGRGDIPSSVHAMKAGAIDFLTKPVPSEKLLSAIALAEARESQAREVRDRRRLTEQKLAMLTPRERQVLDHVVMGQLNKQIATALGTVEKTIKVHRGRMMSKMGIRSVAELVRLVERANVGPRDAVEQHWPLDQLDSMPVLAEKVQHGGPRSYRG